MSQIITKPISKVRSGITSLTQSPVRFMVSLGIGFALGVIADLIMVAIVRYTSTDGWGSLEVGFPFYYTHTHTQIAYDDLLLLAISILMLFTKKFVLTLGFTLGWYISSCNNFYGVIIDPLMPTTA